MTARSDLDARLVAFLAEQGTVQAPDRLARMTRERIAVTSQVSGRLAGRIQRGLVRPRTLWAAAAILAAVVVGVGSLLSSRPAVVGSPAGSAAPSPTSSYQCPRNLGTCRGPLRAGVYTTGTFVPAFTYTVPDGWNNSLDLRQQFDLTFLAGGRYTYPDGTTFHDAISVFRDPVAESAVSKTPQAGVGHSARDLALWLTSHQDLLATGLTAVNIGGASGYRLAVGLPAGPRTSPDHCTSDHGEPACESLFMSADPSAQYGFGIVGPETAVIYLLDVPSGDTLMVVIDDVDGIARDALVSAATPVVNRFRFIP